VVALPVDSSNARLLEDGLLVPLERGRGQSRDGLVLQAHDALLLVNLGDDIDQLQETV